MGRASANRLAEAGANIAIVDLNQEGGEALVKELAAKHAGQKFIFRSVDVTDAEAVEKAVDSIASELGSVTGLVCSAGSECLLQTILQTHTQ